MRTIIISAALLLAIACGEAENNDTTNTTNSADTVAPASTGISPCNCYMAVLKRDTVVAALISINTEITGRLTFDNFEKDGSSGNAHGKQAGDTIKLWYNFFSEGMRSVMEVYFKKEGDHLLRGLGDVEVSGDTAYYSKKGSITFDDKVVYEKRNCDSILPKYRCDGDQGL